MEIQIEHLMALAAEAFGGDYIYRARRKAELRERLVAVRAAFERTRADALEEAAKIAERHYIPGHSVAGPHFAARCASAIRALSEG